MLTETEQAVELRRRVLAGEVDVVDRAAKRRSDEGDSDGVDLHVEVSKIDERLGIVFGYAIVCKNAGEEYYDVQGDHIPEDAMLRATAEFMTGRRVAKIMHAGDPAGQVVFGFPVTEDIAASLAMSVTKTGFIVGMRPDDQEVMQKFRDGELTGFSIGGRRIAETVVEED